MTSAVLSFVPLRPTYRGPVEFLTAMGAIGATAILTRFDGGTRLDFRVSTERGYRATVLLGERSTWSIELWEEATALAVTLVPNGRALLDSANDDVRTVDLTRLIVAREVEPAAVLQHQLAAADAGTPAALFRALAAIGGEMVLRRDEDGLGIGFAAPGRREVRLDALLGSCGRHRGDWWLGAVAELGRLFPHEPSPWTMRPGEVRRLRLRNAIDRGATHSQRTKAC